MVQMAVLIGIGALWRPVRPGGQEADSVRAAISALVYYLLLPALILSVLWEAPLGTESWRISLSASGGVLALLGLTWILLRLARASRVVTGTLLLASAWPNATYLGLPVLEATFGNWARRIAIQYDLFACSPLLLTVGVLIASHYGRGDDPRSPLLALLKVPPLWAALAAVVLNLAGPAPPPSLERLLGDLGQGVPALMLLALGMSLSWGRPGWERLPPIGLALVLQLAVQPLLVAVLASLTGLTGDVHRAVSLEGAMPTMVLGLVLCDRYGLDTGLYAAIVTVTTAASLVTLPLWFALLGG